MSQLITARAQVPGTLISDYQYRAVEGARELILLLHGYTLSGQIMMERFAHCCPEDAAILAPNGPYPLPERQADGKYRVGFSWYFYNPANDTYFIDRRVAIELLEGMVRALGLAALPKRIVGFSQGGYLAPFAALGLGQVSQIVSVAAEYLPDDLDTALRARSLGWPPGFRADSVHGSEDDIVSLKDSQEGHAGMLARGAKGQFVLLEGEGHRMSASVQRAVRNLLRAN
jgi:predicted esterase